MFQHVFNLVMLAVLLAALVVSAYVLIFGEWPTFFEEAQAQSEVDHCREIYNGFQLYAFACDDPATIDGRLVTCYFNYERTLIDCVAR